MEMVIEPSVVNQVKRGSEWVGESGPRSGKDGAHVRRASSPFFMIEQTGYTSCGLGKLRSRHGSVLVDQSICCHLRSQRQLHGEICYSSPRSR